MTPLSTAAALLPSAQGIVSLVCQELRLHRSTPLLKPPARPAMKPNKPIQALAALLALAALPLAHADELPLVHADDFSDGAEAWFPSHPEMWEVAEVEGGSAYRLKGNSAYRPEHRSPHSISLLKDVVLGDFVLTAKVRTLQRPTGHRDMCLFFGYQDPSRFYYVHLGQDPDPHSSQIFIVDEAPRTAITENETAGIPWEDGTWHEVKLVRRVADGLIELYFDDMETPAMSARDTSFAWGLVGLGSFDDPGEWTDVEIRGTTAEGEPVLFTPHAEGGGQ